MAHKIVNSSQAVELMRHKAVSIDTLASAIVRGQGLNMTDDKAVFFAEYTRVSNQLSDEFEILFGRLFGEEWAERSE